MAIKFNTKEDTSKVKGNGFNTPVTGMNAGYVESLYDQWLESPDSVDESWQYFFSGFDMAMCPRTCVAADQADAQSRVASLIYAYRSQGHLIAQNNPLWDNPINHPDLDLETYNFTENDLTRVFDTGHLYGPKRASLGDVIQFLKKTYCGSIGVQYTHIEDKSIRRWLQSVMEPVKNSPNYSSDIKHDILERLIDAEVLEKFIQSRYPGQKRFSLEGAETLIPAVHAIAEIAPDLGIEEVVIGMAHRGRLNILANILDKPYTQIFSEFEGNFLPESIGGDGDVKYHKGFSSIHEQHYGGDKKIRLSLAANPSHLEAVNPVVEGKTRAKQRQYGDTENRKKVIPLLIHGDAAFTGQGLVAETLNLSQLEGYKTGGTIHFIINNQIGFTTDPEESRTSYYCTDIAKSIQAPIFHVNGDDPEAVVYAVETALKFRQEFGMDVVVDMLCYRRHGHNESDEPRFTQPQLYKKIKDHPPVRTLYMRQLISEGFFGEEEEKKIAKEFQTRLQKQLDITKSVQPELESGSYDKYWDGLTEPYSDKPVKTGVTRKILVSVGNAMTTIPDGFILNPKIARKLPDVKKSIEKNSDIDWATAEHLAFGSLLEEGSPIRLSGQDSKRGTFSQRHVAWRDMETHREYIPLNNVSEKQANLCAYNSPLSEAAVLGFEYGYSLSEPRMLIIWEAQFGDFANGAQPIIDQFITSSDSKWQRTSGLVLLLPHGYEGQGPEHSNAYLDRYLAACAEKNIQVCNLTTPAQYFHVLRRQMIQPFRKPLIIMSPKSMLRHKMAVSPVDNLVTGRFEEILDDNKSYLKAKRLVLCSGKIYWDLLAKRTEAKRKNTAIIRIEQLYPLFSDKLNTIVSNYKNIDEIVWVQEESKNRGAWSYLFPRLRKIFENKTIRYIGRSYSASPATGSLKRHNEEQSFIVDAAIFGEPTEFDITPRTESELSQ